jgi:hypothetical protein
LSRVGRYEVVYEYIFTVIDTTKTKITKEEGREVTMEVYSTENVHKTVESNNPDIIKKVAPYAR